MSSCPEIFHKFADYSDACGLGNANDFRRHIAIAEEISINFGIDIDKIYLLFPRTASKPISRYAKESKVRDKVIRNVVNALNNNERVTKKRVDFWLYENGVPLKTEKVSPGKIAKKVMADPGSLIVGDIKTKIAHLKAALTPGQLQILNDIMVKYDHDDELGAISIALIWAKERLENE